MTSLRPVRVGDAEFGQMRQWLNQAGLALSDLDEPGQRFIMQIDEGGGTLAYAGLAGRRPDSLLRSVVVDPSRRGQGIGLPFLVNVEAYAADQGVERLWLLTDSAAPFFESAGYLRRDRADAPLVVRASSQFSGLCPASAVMMCKTLR